MGAVGSQCPFSSLHRGPAGLLHLPADHVEAVLGRGPSPVAALDRLLRNHRRSRFLSVQSKDVERLRDTSFKVPKVNVERLYTKSFIVPRHLTSKGNITYPLSSLVQGG